MTRGELAQKVRDYALRNDTEHVTHMSIDIVPLSKVLVDEHEPRIAWSFTDENGAPLMVLFCGQTDELAARYLLGGICDT